MRKDEDAFPKQPMTTQTKADVVDAQIEEVSNAASLADTPFSKLFHEARTTGRNRASSVTLQVRVRDGAFEVHDEPVKTRQGEHLRGTGAWDGMVKLPVRAFMDTQTAKNEITRQLRSLKQQYTRHNEKDVYA